MRVTTFVLTIWLACLAASEPLLEAQAGRPAAALPAAASTIRGRALSAGDDPLPGWAVRLRSLQENKLAGAAKTDSFGAFEFSAPWPGSYVVELLDEHGAVRAVSPLVDLSDPFTVFADVRLSNDKPPAGVVASHRLPRALLIALAAAGSGLVAAAVVGQDSTPVR